MWPTRSRRIPTVSPACSRSTCWRRTRPSACATGSAEAHRHAAVHHRQHHAGPGVVARRSEDLSGLGMRRRARPLDLPADVRQGLPADDQDDRALPQGAHHPRPHGAAGAGRWAALCGGRQPVRARALSQRLSQADAAQLHRVAQRQGDAGDLLRQAGRRHSARSASPGARTIRRRKARCPSCLRSRRARSPRCRRPTRIGFSARPRRPSTRPWPSEGA